MCSLLSCTWSAANEVVSGENSPLPLFSVTKHDARLQITRGPSALSSGAPPPRPEQTGLSSLGPGAGGRAGGRAAAGPTGPKCQEVSQTRVEAVLEPGARAPQDPQERMATRRPGHVSRPWCRGPWLTFLGSLSSLNSPAAHQLGTAETPDGRQAAAGPRRAPWSLGQAGKP